MKNKLKASELPGTNKRHALQDGMRSIHDNLKPVNAPKEAPKADQFGGAISNTAGDVERKPTYTNNTVYDFREEKLLVSVPRSTIDRVFDEILLNKGYYELVGLNNVMKTLIHKNMITRLCSKIDLYLNAENKKNNIRKYGISNSLHPITDVKGCLVTEFKAYRMNPTDTLKQTDYIQSMEEICFMVLGRLTEYK